MNSTGSTTAMSTPDLTWGLAQLLSNPRLRDLFARDADEAARRLGLVGTDTAAFRAMSAHQVNAQAQALIDKRFREVAKLLPRTMARLGADARDLDGRPTWALSMCNACLRLEFDSGASVGKTRFT